MAIFVVHEHHAKNLHFDFRLEIAGVLKSWAIPKGPSMNPADKRLAILVDDHPIEYADFEGIIPDGYYGAGPVVIWDRGEFEIVEGSFNKKKLVINLRGGLLKGQFSLFALKGKEKEWLLVKRSDEFADKDFKLKTLLESRRLEVRIPPCNKD
jgi:bifunctional non-homologous end joining protein LigD